MRQSLSEGFTFAWYRIAVTLPESIDGVNMAGYRVWFETNFDNYGEVWVNGEIDRAAGSIVGLNTPHRVEIAEVGEPGSEYVIACLCLNGPLAAPRGGIFMRFATLAFEATDKTDRKQSCDDAARITRDETIFGRRMPRPYTVDRMYAVCTEGNETGRVSNPPLRILSVVAVGYDRCWR